ncbi:uncharacterized protein RJT20DRAFT_125254 [Scheffersomyces xylosifermentans]|uniref:uncharacterized protein n=1 Tax=Scheffersomyces xylosifermentans TaxID=1304137 RepID=UPI00315D9D78
MANKLTVFLTPSQIETLDNFIHVIEETVFSQYSTDQVSILNSLLPPKSGSDDPDPLIWQFHQEFEFQKYEDLVIQSLSILRLEGDRELECERVAFKFDESDKVGVLIRYRFKEYCLIFPDLAEYQVLNRERILFVRESTDDHTSPLPDLSSRLRSLSINSVAQLRPKQSNDTICFNSIAWKASERKIKKHKKKRDNSRLLTSRITTSS